MPPNDGSGQATQVARERIDLLRQKLRAAPAPVKAVGVAAVLVLVVLTPFLWGRLAYLIIVIPLLYGPIAVVRGSRSVIASVGVGLWGLAIISIVAAKLQRGSDAVPLLLLPVAIVLVAHIPTFTRLANSRPQERAFAPCRTVALVLAWSVPPALVAWWLDRSQPVIAYAVAWGLAVLVLSWRFAKVLQRARGDTRQRARGAMTAPYGPAGPGPGGRMADLGRGVRATEGVRGQVTGAAPRDPGLAGAEQPPITVDQVMAELAAMVGLEPVKEQIRQIAASVEAAERRRDAGYQTDKPLQHFVFLGPPGTGKTSVARIIAKIYYAYGLLRSPNVVEAQRADLVGEYLGATAIKTNELINRAAGGVLFIDEAYSLANDGEGHADRFGNEAVQALLKRAEDDRDDLVVILAGYQRQMEDFLASNPGLNSRFAMRIRFPGYSPAELQALAQAALAQRGESLDGEATRALTRMMEDVGRRRVADELIDSALGGVLFIDEAYSLYNEGYSGGDAYGSEAVATLLKRAEDDRDRLVIVLAGYPQDMDRFLRSNPGLASRFSVRISFPSYTAGELAQIMAVIAEHARDSFDPEARPVLQRIFRDACDRGRIDELGNGRFARSLFERACAARDLRVATLGETATAADLTTLTAADIETAVEGLIGGRNGLSGDQGGYEGSRDGSPAPGTPGV